ncbi:TRAP transporter small permease [Muricoccus radiodurans]|uniref:TRAP transporter small permease n=1 Tax=Muricoccus radiodurans TaxID=2231721 RepID=UPI003CF11E3E
MRDLLRKPEEAVSVLLGVLLFSVLIWQVFTRYVLGDPSTISEELARYLYVGVVFFGAAAAVSSRAHIGMPFIVERLPPRVRLVTNLITQALSVMFCVAIVVYGIRAAGREWDLPTVAMEIPTGLVLAAVPAAMACAAIRLVLNMVQDLQDWRRRGDVQSASTASDF